MTALDELHWQCERRGWRLALTGRAHWADGTPADKLNLPGMLLDGLEVRGPRDTWHTAGGRELLARAGVDGIGVTDLDAAAVDLAQALAMQGLIG